MRFWFSFIFVLSLSGLFFPPPAAYAAPAGKARKTVRIDPAAAARKKESERKFKKVQICLY